MSTAKDPLLALRQVVQRTWGFSSFRPLQEQAMQAELSGQDSLVVMPTGGGKSLCYQAPSLVRKGVTVVVSPLISLMKDQVDGLQTLGISAIQLDSSLTAAERFAYEQDLMEGSVKILFVSPERLASQDFRSLLQRVGVESIAIDEAHCISHWGHDFRPEYRQMDRLKSLFPKASVHAYTATATEQVRSDICKQLSLRDPLVLVGSFDRPNLTFRVWSRLEMHDQIAQVIERHPNEAGIIYCMRRKDVEEIHTVLRNRGLNSLPYHAGLDREERRKTQDAFSAEKCNLIVATVAFGMGIDRSNIRWIVHTAMPKSIEHYQQETGRAGRDGLEAECVLLHSGQDVPAWQRIMRKSAEEAGSTEHLASGLKHLEDIDRYARGAVCRHAALVRYFGQKYDQPTCGACDLCLGDAEPVDGAVVLAQKILSGVARVQERFGVNHVIGVLRGENLEKIRSLGHDKLTVFGLLRDFDKMTLRDWIYQLIGQGVLLQVGDEYPVLKLNEGSWAVMRKQREVRLLQPRKKKSGEKEKKTKAEEVSWEGVDRAIFDDLRDLRKELAESRGVPPYIIFNDATLRELARVRPSTLDKMRLVYGVGERKLEDFGPAFLAVILNRSSASGLDLDQAHGPVAKAPPKPAAEVKGVKKIAFDLFREGASVEDVIHQTQRARSTIMDYLADYIQEAKPDDISQWVTAERYALIVDAAKRVGSDRLKPIFLELGEKVAYDEIRIVISHFAAE